MCMCIHIEQALWDCVFGYIVVAEGHSGTWFRSPYMGPPSFIGLMLRQSGTHMTTVLNAQPCRMSGEHAPAYSIWM